ncbi:MAG: hypothetical protein CR977_00800 [Gammaproteobacteria bacterium]|nr:MAG: hypothetical protein CR977_00800 [Gammaproteobacteria bacterium]
MPTVINASDLLIYPSERLTDTPDGGGLMVGTALTGAKNELFSPVSTIDRVNGAFNMRKIFPAVLRPDDEPIYGANFIVAMPPITPNWSFLAFKAISEAEERASAASRVAEYNIKTIESRMVLMSTQTVGSRIIQAYQRVEAPLPKVGEVYCLDQNKTGYPVEEQYIRVRSVSDEVRTFTDANDKEFDRRVVTIETDARLDFGFIGVDYPVRGRADPPCEIKETHVADSASYYGVKKAKANAAAGDLKIQAESLFEKIIPTNEIETPLVNQSIGGETTGYMDAAKTGVDGIVSYTVNNAFNGGDTMYTGNAITPGSLDMETGGVAFTDSGGILFANGEPVGKVDYSGSFRLNDDSASYPGTKTIKFRPAGAAQTIADTAAIPINVTNRRRNYVLTLDPPPAPGSLSLSYRAQGNWYDLHDNGSGTLTGVSAEYGTGGINYATSTMTLTLDTMPDVDTALLLSWSTAANYFNRADAVIAVPQLKATLSGETVAPGTVSITHTLGTTTDDGQGVLSGGGLTGSVNYSSGELVLTFDTLPAVASDFTVDYSAGTKQTETISPSGRDGNNRIVFNLAQTNIAPRSLRFDTELESTEGQTRAITLTDDGQGNIIGTDGNSKGEINYATGAVSVNPDTGLDVWVEQTHYNRPLPGTDNYCVTWQIMNFFFAHTSSDFTVSYYSGAVATQQDIINLDNITVDLTPRYGEHVIEGSVCFKLGDEIYFARAGQLYYDLNAETGQGIPAGNFNYQTGVATVTAWQANVASNCTLLSLLTSPDIKPVAEVAFRLPVAPIAPQSMQLLGSDTAGNSFDIIADAGGSLTAANAEGSIDVETGITRVKFGELVTAAGNESEPWYHPDAVDVNGMIWRPATVFADTLRYNAVGYTYMPVDTERLGVDSARLPSDGRVPIFRPGDTIVIAARWQQDLGSAFAAGDVVQLNQTEITVLCLVDSDNKHVLADLYEYDLTAGTITFADAIDPGEYTLPLIARYAKEEENKVTAVDIDGTLTLQFELSRAYDKANTVISSALIGGDLQVRATKPFSQQTWNNVWSDERQTGEILAQLDTRNYPIVMTDDGTMTERWLIKFTNGTQFDLYGETVGLAARTDILQDLAPLNPATGKPYFIIPKEAFGDSSNSAWVNGNCVRFNTYGTSMPLWLIRAVQPSSDPQIDDDGYAVILRADTVEV